MRGSKSFFIVIQSGLFSSLWPHLNTLLTMCMLKAKILHSLTDVHEGGQYWQWVGEGWVFRFSTKNIFKLYIFKRKIAICWHLAYNYYTIFASVKNELTGDYFRPHYNWWLIINLNSQLHAANAIFLLQSSKN